MGLFSILLENTTAVANSGDENKTGSSNNKTRKSTFPTVVQLFHDSTHPFVFPNDTTMHKIKNTSAAATKKSILPKFAALHYSAIQCTLDETDLAAITETTSPKGLRHRPNKEEIILVPDLGVWNCRVLNQTSSSNLTDALLPLTTANNKSDGGSGSDVSTAFCMVVDLVSQTPSQVEPVITQMQQALVRYLIQHGEQQQSLAGNEDSAVTTFTTSLHDLRSVSFGLADQDEKSKAQISSCTTTTNTSSLEDRNIRIALQICVRVPDLHGMDEEDYTLQQEHQFLMYHLRKYAAALNASLVFVADPTTTQRGVESASPTESKQHQRQPTVTVSQLSIIWRELAKGKPVWSDPVEGVTSTSNAQPSLLEGDATTNADATNPEEETYSLIYGPGNHQPELIESVLLRNASYPGHWNASTDSIWKVFPPENVDAEKSPTNKPTTAGDDLWLEELRASLASVPGLQTPPPKSSNTKEPPSATKTPNDAAVSSFFEGLLK